MDMQTGWNENRALLRGTAAAEPVVSHESHGVVYETFPLTVLRLSARRIGSTCWLRAPCWRSSR